MTARDRNTTKKASVIIKQGFRLDDCLGEDTPVPEITIVANANGFRELSEFFLTCASDAEGLPNLHPDAAIRAYRNLTVTWPPFDYDHCDHVEIVVAPFNDQTRDKVFKRFRISKSTARRDSIIERNADIERAVAESLKWKAKDNDAMP